ncbi:MAG: anion permease [Candidatus Limnocylindrales bacterium]
MSETVLLGLAALAFAAVAGANDGATLIALSLPNAALRPLSAVAILAAAVALVPLVVGVRVAGTVARGLVPFEGRDGKLLFLGAVIVALGVTGALSRRGLPTSLTLALVGAIVGTGIGRGLGVAWGTVGGVLLIGLAAPLVSGLLGLLIARAFAWLPPGPRAWGELRTLGALAFLLQAAAYATNDGQKMIAIFAIALGLGPGGQVGVALWSQALLGLAFAAGTLSGIARVARRLDQGVLQVRLLHSVASEFAAAGAVFGSALLGAPVSTTQAATAGVVGAGISQTVWRVRWEQAARIGTAWVLTLPGAAVLGVVAALVLRVLR